MILGKLLGNEKQVQFERESSVSDVDNPDHFYQELRKIWSFPTGDKTEF